jgi:hypothetical protein
MPAAVVRVVTGRVDRERGAQCLGQREPLGQQVEHPRDAAAAEDRARGAVQRGVVGRPPATHADRAAPSPAVA